MTTNSRPGTYTIDPRAERFEAIAREASWRMEEDERRATAHICGRCRTPFGRSAIACANDRTGVTA